MKFIETGLYRRLVAWAEIGDPPILLLMGRPGSGKTEAARHVAERYIGDVFWIAATQASRLELMFGFWELRATSTGTETVFTKGDLMKGLETPNALVVIDDAHLVAPDLQLLNGVGDSTRRFTVHSLGQTFPVAEGVRVLIIANPPPANIAAWDRDKFVIPEQIRDRAIVIIADDNLTFEEELEIAGVYFPDSCPPETREGVVEIVRNLRTNDVLSTYAPSLRSVVIMGTLVSQGVSLERAFLEAVANKFASQDEQAVAIEAYKARFGIDPKGEMGPVTEEGEASGRRTGP